MIAWASLAVALGLLAISIYRVRRDLLRDDLPTPCAAVPVGLTYIVHGAAVLWAAISRVWPMPWSEPMARNGSAIGNIRLDSWVYDMVKHANRTDRRYG